MSCSFILVMQLCLIEMILTYLTVLSLITCQSREFINDLEVDILPPTTMGNTIINIRLITEAETKPCYWVLSTLTYVLLLYRFLGLPYIYFPFAKLRLYFHSITIHLSNVLVVSSKYHVILCQYYGCFIISPLTSIQTGTQQVCISSPSLHSLI